MKNTIITAGLAAILTLGAAAQQAQPAATDTHDNQKSLEHQEKSAKAQAKNSKEEAKAAKAQRKALKAQDKANRETMKSK